MEVIWENMTVYGHATCTVMKIYVFSISFKIDDWLKFLQKTYLANGFVDPMDIYSWASICFLCFLCEVHSYPLRKWNFRVCWVGIPLFILGQRFTISIKIHDKRYPRITLIHFFLRYLSNVSHEVTQSKYWILLNCTLLVSNILWS